MGQAVGRQRFLDRLGEASDGVAEHLAAVHHQMARLVGLADGAVDIQDVAQRALGVDVGGQHAAGFCVGIRADAQEHRAGTVAKQHAGAAVLPVQMREYTSLPMTRAP